VDSGGDAVDAYVVVYSVTDRSSFVYAQSCLADLKRRRKTLPPPFRPSAVVLVSNKQDLVRNRVVSESGTTCHRLRCKARPEQSRPRPQCQGQGHTTMQRLKIKDELMNSFCVSNRDDHGSGIPNWNGNPMGFPW